MRVGTVTGSRANLLFLILWRRWNWKSRLCTRGRAHTVMLWYELDLTFFSPIQISLFSCLGFQRGGPVSCHGPLGNNKLHTASPSNLVWPITVIKTISGESQTLLSQDLPFAKCIGVSNIVKLHRQNRISHFLYFSKNWREDISKMRHEKNHLHTYLLLIFIDGLTFYGL